MSAAALPVAVVLAEVRELFELEYAAAAIPASFVGGLATLSLARRGRLRIERTLGRARGRFAGGLGRLLGILAILLALAGAIAIATFVLLERAGETRPLPVSGAQVDARGVRL